MTSDAHLTDATTAVFLGHGGGPMPLIGDPGHDALVETWAPGSPMHDALHAPGVEALIVVSAHHESRDGSVLVMMDESPGLLFDYSGFPPETYTYTMPNPGAPELAKRVLEALQAAGVAAREERDRGHDHGVFVPLLGLGVHEARPGLPVVSVSLRGPAAYPTASARGEHEGDLTRQHWELGRALAPLLGDGTLLIGSGNTFHGRATKAEARAFDEHLRALAEASPAHLRRWENHPAARKCHPRPEHLLPLLVCAGAASDARVRSVPHDFMGYAASHFLFGAAA